MLPSMSDTNRSLDELIHDGTHIWFTQDPDLNKPIVDAFKSLDQNEERVRAWLNYFEGVQLHFEKNFSKYFHFFL